MFRHRCRDLGLKMTVNSIYPTPVTRYDSVAQVVIVEHRNPDTGKLSYQEPTADVVRSDDENALAIHPPAAPPLKKTAAADDTAKPDRAGSISLLV